MIVGLRHDVDTVYGLRWGLPKIISIEKKYDVRSTFFVRVDVVHSDKDLRVLKRIADEGWEIGLHLINTINDSKLMSPEDKLKSLRKLLGVPIYGVTPCGSTIGFKGDVTWRIMDSLGLIYMEGYGMPDFRWTLLCFRHTCPLTFIMLGILERRKDIEGLRRICCIGLNGMDWQQFLCIRKVCENCARPWFDEVSFNVAEKRDDNKVYEKFLCEFKNKVELKKYISMC